RFSELHQQVKSILWSKDLGGLTSVSIVTGNVGMAMIGTHMFDLFSFMTGEKVREVAAWLCPDTSTNPRGEQVKDSGGTVVLATENGKRLYLNAGTQQGHGITVVYGAKYGQLVEDLLTGSIRVLHRKEEDRELPTSRYGTTSVESSLKPSTGNAVTGTQELLRRLLDGGEFPGGADGRQAVEVLAAAYLSSESRHRTVRLDDPAVPRERIFPWP